MNPPTKVKKTHVYRVQVLDRAFQILDLLADEKSGVGLMEVAQRLKLHKSTAHRLIMSLELRRFVEKNTITGKYHLGSRLMELGLSAVARLDVYEVAGPHLRTLVKETGETAHLGVLRDGQVVSLVNIESSQTLRTPATVGTRTPAHCTSLGKAMLAFATQEHIDDFLRGRKLEAYTPMTITSAAKFKAELRAIGKRGYAIDNQEREPGLRCIGAPCGIAPAMLLQQSASPDQSSASQMTGCKAFLRLSCELPPGFLHRSAIAAAEESTKPTPKQPK